MLTSPHTTAIASGARAACAGNNSGSESAGTSATVSFHPAAPAPARPGSSTWTSRSRAAGAAATAASTRLNRPAIACAVDLIEQVRRRHHLSAQPASARRSPRLTPRSNRAAPVPAWTAGGPHTGQVRSRAGSVVLQGEHDLEQRDGGPATGPAPGPPPAARTAHPGAPAPPARTPAPGPGRR